MFKFVCELLQLAPCNVLSQIFSFFSTQSTSYTTAPFSNTAENSQVKTIQKVTTQQSRSFELFPIYLRTLAILL